MIINKKVKQVTVTYLLRYSECLLSNDVSKQSIALRKHASPLRELTCHMRSHGVTCHPAVG